MSPEQKTLAEMKAEVQALQKELYYFKALKEENLRLQVSRARQEVRPDQVIPLDNDFKNF